jgi:hypothetical protein
MFQLMKAKQSIAASAAIAAAVGFWIARIRKKLLQQQGHAERKCMQDELDRFEGEGGLVLS